MHENQKGRPRPPYLRALGRSDPPMEIEVDGRLYRRLEIFKHDSWAATAVYALADDASTYTVGGGVRPSKRVVCKFNRQAPIGLLPLRWLGRFLARRETAFLTKLEAVPGVPAVCREVRVEGKRAPHVSAHEFIEGNPLSVESNLGIGFFDQLDQLLGSLHERRIVYVDLHKQENILVGSNGRPYFMDFQVSLHIPDLRWLDPLLRLLCECDRYHVSKHRAVHHVDGSPQIRPWIIRMHRKIGVPLRSLRRRILVWLGVRRGDGYAASEIAPEVGLRS